ncbi:hypothetical protein JKP88DRAFT_253743 [Tribonema minus]|uniref:Uncharacterized protein n=1 Tax=Tribonema minus TaxID=303371 RepID=A0A835Z6F3_9STRA|nr:hypothetical protein JKP88DRAFT_253743 [Tribonema minus]
MSEPATPKQEATALSRQLALHWYFRWLYEVQQYPLQLAQDNLESAWLPFQKAKWSNEIQVRQQLAVALEPYVPLTQEEQELQDQGTSNDGTVFEHAADLRNLRSHITVAVHHSQRGGAFYSIWKSGSGFHERVADPRLSTFPFKTMVGPLLLALKVVSVTGFSQRLLPAGVQCDRRNGVCQPRSIGAGSSSRPLTMVAESMPGPVVIRLHTSAIDASKESDAGTSSPPKLVTVSNAAALADLITNLGAIRSYPKVEHFSSGPHLG